MQKKKRSDPKKLLQAKISEDVATDFHVVARIKGMTMRKLLEETCLSVINQYKLTLERTYYELR